MSIFELLLKGGWVMIPILILSILAVYAILERLIVLSKGTGSDETWLNSLQEQILRGDIQGAELLCEQKDSIVARVIKAGIKNLDHSSKTIETAMEATGQVEVNKLEKNLSLLGTIAGTAPMLGFLGTVTGMIQAFMTMAQSTSSITPQLLSAGIYEAMITTAAGLAVGIVADLGYKYILIRVQKATYHMEHAANQFILFTQSYLKQLNR
jgi:biopolymer transport protein ExbB